MSEYKLDGYIQSLVLDDVLEVNIETSAFCPSEETTLVSTASTQYNTALKSELMANGFYVKPDTDGDLWVITRRAYVRNNNSLTGLIPVNLNGKAGVWEPVLVVKVFPKSNTNTTTDSEGSNWDSAASNICVGISR